MNESTLDSAIKRLLQKVFEILPAEVTDQTRRGAVERWDSLGHLDLLEALRAEFRVNISPEQALDIESVGDIKRIIADSRSGNGRR